MTNGWIDIKNTDMMLIMGGNPAENHPCGFKWVVEAKKTRNARLLVIDPRFTRTAAVADMLTTGSFRDSIPRPRSITNRPGIMKRGAM
jgi:anaerobic selenocysteine-containing dehydrogenase